MKLDKERPNICNEDIDLDDWLADDIYSFAEKIVKTMLLLEKDNVLNTNLTDKYFMDVCNKVHQALYKEAERQKDNPHMTTDSDGHITMRYSID